MCPRSVRPSFETNRLSAGFRSIRRYAQHLNGQDRMHLEVDYSQSVRDLM